MLLGTSNIDGGGWILVRRVKPGHRWHPARDNLTGTQTYGKTDSPQSPSTFSVRFDKMNFNQFLFATDEKKWLITTKNEVYRRGSNFVAHILKSSRNPNGKSTARWYNRGTLEDPWISLTDHGHAIHRGGVNPPESACFACKMSFILFWFRNLVR